MSKYNRKQAAASESAGGTPPPDEFIGFWQKVSRAVSPHTGKLFLLVLGGFVLAGVMWGIGQFSYSRREAASEELAQAMRIYQADLLGEKDTPSETDEAPRFKTAKERADAALSALDKLNKDYGSSDAAVRGVLLRASILFDQGRFDEADAAYHQFLDKQPKDPAMLALAREGLGLCDEARNKLDAALAIYREPSAEFYRDRLLMDQARIYVKKGDKKKAAEIYKEILTKSPNSPLRDDINNRLLAVEN